MAGLFLTKGIINKRGGVLDETYTDIANDMKSSQLAPQHARAVLGDRHVKNYGYN